MYVFVYMYVCMYICMYVCIYNYNYYCGKCLIFYIVRPVVRPKGVESGGVIPPGGNTRDALLAVAGVQMINQSKRSPLLAK